MAPRQEGGGDNGCEVRNKTSASNFLLGHASPGCPTHAGDELPYFVQKGAKEQTPEAEVLLQSFLRQPTASARANMFSMKQEPLIGPPA